MHWVRAEGPNTLDWKEHPKVVENDRAKILWDFQIQTEKLVIVKQPDIMLVDKQQKKGSDKNQLVIGHLIS